MHSAYMKINKADRALIFRAQGHSGYAERGQDIVCAGASILAMTLAETLTAAYQAGWVGDTAIVELSGERSEVSCVADNDDVFGELARAYLMIATGYRLLALHYPENVKFTTEIKL